MGLLSRLRCSSIFLQRTQQMPQRRQMYTNRYWTDKIWQFEWEHSILNEQGAQELFLPKTGHFHYRALTPAPRKNQVIAQVILGSMWFWILWRFYHEPEDVFGHFILPDPSKWTDTELGIPPDDED